MNNRKSLIRLAVAALLVALGVLLSPLSVPVGAAKIFPVQHALNVMAAVILGCRYGTAARPFVFQHCVIFWAWERYWLIPAVCAVPFCRPLCISVRVACMRRL